MSPARRWTQAEKERALRIAAEQGYRQAGEATGIPHRTIQTWARRETERASAAIEVAGVVTPELVSTTTPWQQRREPLVDTLGEAVGETLVAVRSAVEGGRLRDAKDGAIALAVLIDKAELLAGRATSRSESKSLRVNVDLDAEIAELERELGIGG